MGLWLVSVIITLPVYYPSRDSYVRNLIWVELRLTPDIQGYHSNVIKTTFS